MAGGPPSVPLKVAVKPIEERITKIEEGRKATNEAIAKLTQSVTALSQMMEGMAMKLKEETDTL